MSTKTLTVQTPVGEFSRSTHSDYKAVVVRRSERCYAAYLSHESGKSYGAFERMAHKNRGYAVTWHKSLRTAEAAANGKYFWDKESEVIGVYQLKGGD